GGCHSILPSQFLFGQINMSSQRGNLKKGAPKYQNSFAFTHNPKSKKTDHILGLPIHGLCPHCHAQIVWRKKYRKYKPLTQPASWYAGISSIPI
ncbi:hypothetical protein DYB31_011063, partial [Aphanomyces astaci]